MFKTAKVLLTGMVAAGLLVSTSAFSDELAKIKEKGELSVALTGAYPPFSLINEQNQVVGFDVSVGKEIATRLGVKGQNRYHSLGRHTCRSIGWKIRHHYRLNDRHCGTHEGRRFCRALLS